MTGGGWDLTAAQQRVLGALMEKQRTVPASYPLSLNALRIACNQSSSRDPVVDYDDEAVLATLKELKEHDLVRSVWAGKGFRTVKYHQTLTEQLQLDQPGAALITVLLLRGPQTPGELKTRTDRLHSFADRGAVETQLAVLAGADPPLVRELPRRAGRHDSRWMHLLGTPPTLTTADRQISLVDRESVLADGPAARDAAVRAGYETLAGSGELDHLWPLDVFEEWFLGQVADAAAGGPVIDLGCGTGTAAAVLAGHGLQVTGLDLSPAMTARARERQPDVRFDTGDLRRVLRPPTASGWGAAVCRRSLGHLAASELPPAVAAVVRVLAPGGTLGLIVDVGEEIVTVPGTGIPLVLHDPQAVRDAVTGAGARIVDWYLRGPGRGDPPAHTLLLLATV